ncbi:MAG: GreA/GreB family elongation factor [Bacteroidetes bacterium]|nr:GreA/GreB family elongation factor [Bacteroidota bacterium]
MVFNNEEYILLSPQSPLGRVLLGRRKGDRVSINGKDFNVMRLD